MENRISFNFSARYFASDTVSARTPHLWFVLHGYGQLAEFFLRKFSSLPEDHVVVAPEGLSRFYLADLQDGKRLHQRVGATWMTRENREMDIENYLTYLNAVYAAVVPTSFAGKITVLGFSQGAATAVRWVIHHPSVCHRLVVWAGAFPHDMNLNDASRVLASKEVIQVYGLSDPLITDESLANMNNLNRTLGLNPQIITFEGKHEIDAPTLLKLV